jgi:hypothetical protein
MWVSRCLEMVRLFIEPLPSNRWSLLSYHIAPSLRLLVLSSPQVYCHFFFQSLGTELPEVAGVPTVPARKLSVVSSFIWEGASFSTMPCHSFSGVWRKTRLLALQSSALGSAWGPPWIFSCFPEGAAVLCLSLLCHCWMPCLSTHWLSLAVNCLSSTTDSNWPSCSLSASYITLAWTA